MLPASWASALINNDFSGVDYYNPEEAKEIREWVKNSGLSVLSCSDEAQIVRLNGVLTECLEYYCVEKDASAENLGDSCEDGDSCDSLGDSP